MRAVVEQHGSSVDIPPLKILITKGRQDLTVKVCTRSVCLPLCADHCSYTRLSGISLLGVVDKRILHISCK